MRPFELFSAGFAELKTRIPYSAVSKFKNEKVSGQSGSSVLSSVAARHNYRMIPIVSLFAIVLSVIFILFECGMPNGFSAELAGDILMIVTGFGSIIFGFYFKGKYPTYYPYIFWVLLIISYGIKVSGCAGEASGFVMTAAAIFVVAAVPILSTGTAALFLGAIFVYYTIMCLINGIMLYYIVVAFLFALLGLFISSAMYANFCSRTINSRKQKDDNLRMKLNSVIDSRTGLYNRTYGIEQVNEALKARESVAMLLIGIDHFKDYNRANGTDKSDEVLRDICKCIKILVKPKTDLTCRIGGDMAMVCIPADADREAVMTAEEIRSGIRTMNIAFEENSSFGVVTVSVGAARSIQGDSFDSLYSRAERSYSVAKQYGGNCIGFKEQAFRSETDV
ncbi:MAG: GGDEF domain-containing protein [Eubacterium sp.]|nr:GGDEF domain-containing protein [Eubacterium sp.]